MERRMARLVKAAVLMIAVTVSMAGPGGARLPALASTLACGGAWQPVAGANLGVAFSGYRGAASTGPNDGWIVGEYSGWDRQSHALIEHWDGLRWIQMPSPVGGQSSRLNAVAAITPNDAWAVGYSNTDRSVSGGANRWDTLTAHWNGHGWQQVPSPNNLQADRFNMLTGVAASGPADVWAVGYVTHADTQTHDPLVLHWDGARWTEVALPDLGANIFLNAVVALRADDVWVVGGSGLLGESGPVIAHWDGHAWSRRTDAGDEGYFLGVGGAAADDLWAVGTIETPPSSPQRQGFIRHWNGSAWTAVPNPVAAITGSELFGVAAAARDAVWIVGDLGHASADPPPLQTLILHWDGGRWTQMATGDPSPVNGYHFAAVAVAGQGTLWAVGDSKIARYTDPCAAPGPPPGNSGLTYFPQTGHTLGGAFRAYWQAHGGLAQFGYPLTEEFPEVSPTDGMIYTVQYFERNRFEYHPEHAGTAYAVLLGLLGRTVTADRLHEPAFQSASPQSGRWFPQTQHNLAPEFLSYWEAHGGLAVYGYPISEAFTEVSRTDGKPYLVQYFERNRLELHPELPAPFRVSLGLLGVQVLQSRGWVP